MEKTLKNAKTEELLDVLNTATAAKNFLAINQIKAELRERGVVLADDPTPVVEENQNEGSRIADYAKSLGSGLYKGIASIADLPSVGANLAMKGTELAYEKATGKELPEGFMDTARESLTLPIIGNLTEPKGSQAAQALAPQAYAYEPQTKEGEYIQRVGEFAPFAGKNVITQAAIPAVTSKFLGEMEGVKDTNLQLPVEVASAIFSPMIFKSIVSPTGGKISGETKKAVELLQKEGVFPTAAQQSGSKTAQFMEQSTDAGEALIEAAHKNFTKAVLKRIGINSDVAAPELLTKKYNEMGAAFERTMGSVTGAARKSDVDDFRAALEIYQGQAPRVSAAPIFQEIYSALSTSAKTGQRLSNAQLRRFHTTVNSMTRQGDHTGDAARATIGIVKDIIGRNLGKQGKELWQKTNKEYRDFMSIERALAKAGNATVGVITPQNIRSAAQQVYGKRAYVFGKSDLAELGKAGSFAMKPLPDSGTASRLLTQGGAASGSAITSGGAGAALGMGQEGIGALTVLGAAAPRVAAHSLTSPMGQAYLKNQLVQELGQGLMSRMAAASYGAR